MSIFRRKTRPVRPAIEPVERGLASASYVRPRVVAPAAPPSERVLHVYQTMDRGIISRDLLGLDRAVGYGHSLSGVIASTIILHDAPASEADKAWVREVAALRLVPVGIIVHGYPGPVISLEPERPRFKFAGTTEFGNYRFTPENIAAADMLPPGLNDWTVPPAYFWTGDTDE